VPPTAYIDAQSLKRKRAARESTLYQAASHAYWKGEALASALATDAAALHRGMVYRKALIREHWRMRAFADVTGELPLVLRVDGAVHCEADEAELNIPSHAWVESFAALFKAEGERVTPPVREKIEEFWGRFCGIEEFWRRFSPQRALLPVRDRDDLEEVGEPGGGAGAARMVVARREERAASVEADGSGGGVLRMLHEQPMMHRVASVEDASGSASRPAERRPEEMTEEEEELAMLGFI